MHKMTVNSNKIFHYINVVFAVSLYSKQYRRWYDNLQAIIGLLERRLAA